MIDGEVATRSAVRPGRLPGRRPGPSARVTDAVAERRDPVRQVAGGPPVVDGDPGAGVGQEACQGDPAAGQPEDRDRPVAQRAGADRVEA